MYSSRECGLVYILVITVVHSVKESNIKTRGHETYPVFQSVATWFEYLYSPEWYLLGYHIRENVRVYRKESFLMSRQGRTMEMEQATENSSSVRIANHVEICVCDFIYTHTTFTVRFFLFLLLLLLFFLFVSFLFFSFLSRNIWT